MNTERQPVAEVAIQTTKQRGVETQTVKARDTGPPPIPATLPQFVARHVSSWCHLGSAAACVRQLRASSFVEQIHKGPYSYYCASHAGQQRCSQRRWPKRKRSMRFWSHSSQGMPTRSRCACCLHHINLLANLSLGKGFEALCILCQLPLICPCSCSCRNQLHVYLSFALSVGSLTVLLP